ncbi:MAG: tRNA-binding protein [Patescibacteria group bacterium]|nr:tRNA-binding protein [Patescibacteria group bacterium]
MSNEISLSDFQKIDIRIGTVLDATIPNWSHWVMKLTVDFGPDIGVKTVFAGIMKFYAPEEIIGRQFPFVVNLVPKKIGPKDENGIQNYSEGMLLAANFVSDDKDPEKNKPVLFSLSEKVPNGTKVI